MTTNNPHAARRTFFASSGPGSRVVLVVPRPRHTSPPTSACITHQGTIGGAPSYSPTNSLPVLPLRPSLPNSHTLQSGTRAGRFDSGARKSPSPVPSLRSIGEALRPRANGAGGGCGVPRGDPRVVGAALPQHQPHVLLRPGPPPCSPSFLPCSVRASTHPEAGAGEGRSQTDGNPFQRTRVRSAATRAFSVSRRGLVVGGTPMRCACSSRPRKKTVALSRNRVSL
jgi:hypothetical protein